LRKKAIPQTQIQTRRELRELNEAGSFVRIKDALKPELVEIVRDSVTGKFERIIPSDSEDISQLNQAMAEAMDAAIDLMSLVLTKTESSGKRVEWSVGNPNRESTAENLGLVSTMKAWNQAGGKARGEAIDFL
jgi:hypothetical protein